jgi:hypothetical protein
MTDTEIALLQALRVEVAALRATVERGDHSINLLIEQIKILYEDVTNLHDGRARIEEQLRVPAPSLGRGYAGGKAPPAECAAEGCDVDAAVGAAAHGAGGSIFPRRSSARIRM